MSELEIAGDAPNIIKGSICLEVCFSQPGMTKKMKVKELDPDADDEMLHVSKDLLASAEMKAIVRIETAVRSYLKSIQLVSPFRGGGIYLIPLPFAEKAAQFIDGKFAERDAKTKEFLDNYPALKEAAKLRLKEYYDQSEYPTVNKLRVAFDQSRKFFCFGIPDEMEGISDAFLKSEREKHADMFKTIENECRELLRQTMLQLVETINGSLNPGKGADKKIFKYPTVEKLLEFLDTFEARNMPVNDTELKTCVDKARVLLGGGEDAQTLAAKIRDNESFRKKIKKDWSEMTTNLQNMTEPDDGFRSIDFSDLE